MITICYRIISLKFTARFAAAQVSGQTDGTFGTTARCRARPRADLVAM